MPDNTKDATPELLTETLARTPVSEEFAAAFMAAVSESGAGRSEYIRAAIAELLQDPDAADRIRSTVRTAQVSPVMISPTMKKGVRQFADDNRIRPVDVVRLALERKINGSTK